MEKKKNGIFYGIICLLFGTKKKYPNIEHHTIKFGDKYKEHLNDIFDKKN